MAKKKITKSEEVVDDFKVKNSEDKNSFENLFLDDDVDDDEDDDAEEESEQNGNDSDDEDETMAGSPLQKNKKRFAEKENFDETRKKKCKREKDLFKQPTAEELNQLRETETLFHSNLFRLQIEEVLNATRVKDKYKNLFEAWFIKFKNNILSLEESEEIPLASAEKLLKKMKVPQLPVPVDRKSVFKYCKPSRIDKIGSYATGCIAGPEIVIDVTIEMPKKYFQKNDYQNYRYARKRLLYLCWIGKHLDEDPVESKKFIGNIWNPNIRLIPKGKLGKKITIDLHISAQEESFKLNRFSPEKNCVRFEWFFETEEIAKNKEDSFFSTPRYNSIILRDLTISQNNDRSVKIIREYPNLRDAIILLKIWLRQRQLNYSYESFNNHVLTMYVLYLLSTKKLNTYMSSYQIVRNVWINLALSDWKEKGASICQDIEIEKRLDDYKKYYDCVFLDTSGYYNLAANLTVDSYSWIQNEAQRAIKCLDDTNVDSFQILFMRSLPFYRTFDNLLCFNDPSVIEKIVDQSSTKDKLDYGPDKRARAIKMITQILKQGLGKRISNICVRGEKPKEWEMTKKGPEVVDKIVVGLSLNPDYCFDIIDKGPHANLPEAEDFRKFWGNKSELRRFQDGSICESLVWIKGKKNTISTKRIVCKKIVTYLMKEKFDLSKNQYTYIADEIDEFLQLKKIKFTKFDYGTGEEATLQVLRVFDDLTKMLTSLTDLPLSISGVEGFSPVFRYTEVFPPLPYFNENNENSMTTTTTTSSDKNYLIFDKNSIVRIPKFLSKIQASVQLSISGKWPDELEAVRKTKAAFNIQICECLRKQFGIEAHANCRYFDIFHNGLLFRFEIAQQKEIALMKREISDDRIEKYRDNEESLRLEKKLFRLPKLSNALHGLHCQQPCFGPTCCLAKRWLSAHLLDDYHIPQIVVELLVASMFLTPDPYKPAQTPQIAFLRFLEFFARRHWTTEPIFVNFNDEMTREEIVAVENHFRLEGDSNPPLFISTPYDHRESIWSKKAPNRLILNRIGSIAEKALQIIDDRFNSGENIFFKFLFKAPLSEYDFLIRLHSSLNPRRWQYHDLGEKFPILHWPSSDSDSVKKIPIVDFDPVQFYLRELRHGYDEVALFFHDTYGGAVIGVLIKPVALETKEFKVANLNCRKLNDEGKLILDIPAMIEDFSILGKGLVKSIDLQSKNITLN